jgi:hypothetical protein
VNCAIVEMNHQSFLMRSPSSRKDRLFKWNKWNKYICHKISAVHFDLIWKYVDNIKAARIPYDWKYQFLLWISSLGFVATSSLNIFHIRHGDVLNSDQDSSPVTRWCQPSRWAAHRNGNMALVCSFRFERKPSVHRSGTWRKWNDLEPINRSKCLSTVAWLTRSISAIDQLVRKKICSISPEFWHQDHPEEVSTANFVMEVLTTEPSLSNPESNRSEFVCLFIKLCRKSGCNLVGAGSPVPEKSDDHSLIILHDKLPLMDFDLQSGKIFYRERHSEIKFAWILGLAHFGLKNMVIHIRLLQCSRISLWE